MARGLGRVICHVVWGAWVVRQSGIIDSNQAGRYSDSLWPVAQRRQQADNPAQEQRSIIMYTTPPAIAGNLYTQKVTVYWSKASRGMPEADLRAKCSSAFALTAAHLAQLAGENTFSAVLMREPGFESQGSVAEYLTFQDKLDWGAVAVKFPKNAEGVVRYTYSWLHVGAPDRSERPSLACPIRPEELVRVEYNGRSSWPDGQWRYEQTVFNVVLTERPTLEMFLAPPARMVTDLADLW